MSRAEQIQDLRILRAMLANLDQDSVSSMSEAQIDAAGLTIRMTEAQMEADGIELGKLRKRVKELEARAPHKKGTRIVSPAAARTRDGITAAIKGFESRLKEAGKLR